MEVETRWISNSQRERYRPHVNPKQGAGLRNLNLMPRSDRCHNAPMTSLASRLAALATSLLAWPSSRCWGCARRGSGRVASPTPVAATATPASHPPAASRDPLAVFAGIEEQVSGLRGLPAAGHRPARRDQRDPLAESWTRCSTRSGRRPAGDDNVTLRAMGLLTERRTFAS